ncbi:MAG: type IV pilus secretin PilQ [Dokdonella sp.]|uniref:type IV pilus secretin PilQ n=1 Tax=Dokdonella sp. TaxID=2291710 RepID=UPI003267A7C5
MTTTFAATSKHRFASGPIRICVCGMLLLIGILLGPVARAENVLEDLSSTALPGGKVEVTLKFANPATVPQVFSTETPPSIALDFADTRNGFAKRHIDVSAGATSAVSAIEAAGRTRVVVDLFRIAGYETRVNGNNLVLTINNGVMGSSSIAAAVSKSDPTKAVVAPQTVEVSNIDFRRGKNGEGRVVISFTGPGASANLKREGGTINLDLLNVKLPPNQAQHLDVLDFATPVQSIDTRAKNGGIHMQIVAKPPFEQLAYQTGSEYVVEVSQKKDDPKLKGKNAEPEYSGSRVTFNFQDIPARSVLQLIADVSDLNIVVADSVQGNVTLRLINVPWDQALDIVLQAKGLDKRRRGNVIWVAPQKEIAEREESIADARLKLEDKEALVSDYIPVSYGKAKDIASLLTSDAKSGQSGSSSTAGQQQRGFLSSRGSVTFDDRTNTLLVSDIPSKILEIRQLIAVLDRPVQQVLIEARIVIATDSFARELGVKFGVSGAHTDSNGNVAVTSGNIAGADYMADQAFAGRLANGVPYPIYPPGLEGGRVTQTDNNLSNRLNVNMPAANPAGSFGLAILGADYLLDLELSAAQTEGRSEVVSSPRVITANQREADIKQGQEIGYVTYQAGVGGSTGTPTVNFKDVVLELKVTPTITADDRVVLNLNVKKDAVAGYVNSPGGGQTPTIDKREISTEVLVDNGQTVVLGGVYEVSKSDNVKKVPLLGDVPVLGNLFKNKGRNDTKAELLIFVTPRILSDNLK